MVTSSSIPYRRFDSETAFTEALVLLLRDGLGTPRRHPSAVLISGGKTPLGAYHAVARHPFPLSEQAYLAFADERLVPPDSPDSNYGNASSMIRALSFTPGRVLRVHTDLAPEPAAAHYHRDLDDFFRQGGELRAALLGLGADGHTCSLFAQEDLDGAEGRYACAVGRAAGHSRVSVTPRLLAKARRIVFAVRGREKEAATERLLAAPLSLVAGRAVAGHPHVELWFGLGSPSGAAGAIAAG